MNDPEDPTNLTEAEAYDLAGIIGYALPTLQNRRDRLRG